MQGPGWPPRLGPWGSVSAGHLGWGASHVHGHGSPCPPTGVPARKCWRREQDGAGGVQGSGLHHCPGDCPALVAMLCWLWGG